MLMCEKCLELDEKIARYLQLLKLVTDKPALDGIEGFLARYRQERAEIYHPEE
jgi:hypothetical protein